MDFGSNTAGRQSRKYKRTAGRSTAASSVANRFRALAAFIDPSTRGTVRLRTGEGHSGWILQSVERRAATLQKGGQTETLALPRATAVAAPAPVVSRLPPPPPPQAGASAPAPANAPQPQGCMPEPIGC